MPPFGRWAGGRSIRSIAGGGSYQDLKLPPTLSCLGRGSARKNRENILKGVVRRWWLPCVSACVSMYVCVCLCVCVCPSRRSVRELCLPHPVCGAFRHPHSHGKITHERRHVRAKHPPGSFSVRSLAWFPLQPARHTPLTTCVLVSFLESFTTSRVCWHGENFRRKRASREKKSHEQLLSLSVSFPRANRPHRSKGERVSFSSSLLLLSAAGRFLSRKEAESLKVLKTLVIL